LNLSSRRVIRLDIILLLIPLSLANTTARQSQGDEGLW
jgi:hypothetical protein